MPTAKKSPKSKSSATVKSSAKGKTPAKATAKPAAKAKSTVKAKPAAKAKPAVKATATKSAPASATAPALTNYTLAQLVQRIGSTTDAAAAQDAMLYVGAYSDSELTALGAKVATDRISTDCARLLGQALDFWQHASDAQRDVMPALSPRLLSAAIWAAHKDQQLSEAFNREFESERLDQSQRRAIASSLLSQVLRDRNILHGTCTLVVASDPVLQVQLDTISARIVRPAPLAESVTQLVKLLRTLLASKSPGIKARCTELRITPTQLEEMSQRAAELALAAKNAEAPRRASKITQAEVDRWDGICLVLLGRILAQFEAGHSADPTVPRLNAISTHAALYGGKSQRKKPSPEKPVPTPSPATP
jgi:hypothetical protein